jgi:hypothetical protein
VSDIIIKLTEDEMGYLNDLLYCEIREGLSDESLYSIWDKVKGHQKMCPPIITNDACVGFLCSQKK